MGQFEFPLVPGADMCCLAEAATFHSGWRFISPKIELHYQWIITWYDAAKSA